MQKWKAVKDHKNKTQTHFIGLRNADTIYRLHRDMRKLTAAMGHNDDVPKKPYNELKQAIKNSFESNQRSENTDLKEDIIITSGVAKDKCHAEMRIINHILKTGITDQKIYIGISKLCCAGCNLILHDGEIKMGYDNEVVNLTFEARGQHGKGYEWHLIDGFKKNPEIMQKLLGEEAYKIYESCADDKKEDLLKSISKALDGHKARGVKNNREPQINELVSNYSDSEAEISDSEEHRMEDSRNVDVDTQDRTIRNPKKRIHASNVNTGDLETTQSQQTSPLKKKHRANTFTPTDSSDTATRKVSEDGIKKIAMDKRAVLESKQRNTRHSNSVPRVNPQKSKNSSQGFSK